MNNMNALVKLGRFMITHAPKFVDDATCNRWARAGQLLTGLGMPFAPQLREFDAEDQQTVREAAAVMVGKSEMPALMDAVAPDAAPRRTRKARMTKAMSKAPTPKVAMAKAKPVKAKTTKAKVSKAKTVKEAPAKKRGRPPGSKNKPKVVAKATRKSK
jgi:hypothetical protein